MSRETQELITLEIIQNVQAFEGLWKFQTASQTERNKLWQKIADDLDMEGNNNIDESLKWLNKNV